MDAIRAVTFGIFGLVFGSFLTVVVWRVPRRESVVAPRSACPSCGTVISARDNVPILSWLLLGGRCRACRARISAEYPLTEAATGTLFAGASITFASTWVAALVSLFLAVMLAASLIDARHRVIPNRLMYPSLVIAVVLLVVGALAGGGMDLRTAGIGFLAYGGGLLLIALLSPGGMGMGDVKLGALIGLVLGGLGLRYVAVAAFMGVLAGGLGAIVALLLGRGRKDALPFGPYLALGATIAIFAAPQISDWYLGLVR